MTLCSRSFRPIRRLLALGLSVLLSLSAACRPDEDDEADADEPLLRRRATVLIDSCGLDAAQLATLRSMAARQTVSEVVLLCLSLQPLGNVTLRAGTTQNGLRATLAELRTLGYSPGLAVTAVDSDDDEQPADEIGRWLSRAGWQQRSASELNTLAGLADSLHLALPEVVNSARGDLTTWLSALSQKVRPARRLGLFIPPSLREPSDWPGGDAYDVATLLPLFDRLRLLTLEAASGEAPGPNFDADWALSAAKFALQRGSAEKLDLTVPLYGIDFQLKPAPSSEISDETSLSFIAAGALAQKYGQTPQGGAGAALHFAYKDESGNPHEVWYEDSDSILAGLAALSADELSPSVGLVFFGLGGEDSRLFPELLSATASE